MSFLETCAALLAFLTFGGVVAYFSSGGKAPPAADTPDELTNIAHAQYAKMRHLTEGAIDDED
jgi:hypothetical protein